MDRPGFDFTNRILLYTGTMDRIEVLERRVAELEQRLAEVLQRLAEDTSSNAEWYSHCQRRLEMLRSPIPRTR